MLWIFYFIFYDNQDWNVFCPTVFKAFKKIYSGKKHKSNLDIFVVIFLLNNVHYSGLKSECRCRVLYFNFVEDKHKLQLYLSISRSPVTHKMAPWVQRIFIEFLPKLLCIQRPKKEDEQVEELPSEVLTDVFHVPPDVEKYSPFCTNKYSTDFDIPGELKSKRKLLKLYSWGRKIKWWFISCVNFSEVSRFTNERTTLTFSSEVVLTSS